MTISCNSLGCSATVRDLVHHARFNPEAIGILDPLTGILRRPHGPAAHNQLIKLPLSTVRL
jgi:hypothetical protein